MKLKILKVGNDGEGIAYYNKKPVYIYYAYKDEVVDVELVKNKRGVYEGNINKIITPSPHRVKPICPYYTQVGSSNLMHINYNEQLNYKKEFIHFHLNTKLRKLARGIRVNKTVRSSNEFYYRNKIDLPVRFLDGKNEVGLYKRATNWFVKIDGYVLHQKVLDEVCKNALELMNKFNINGYDEKTKEGYITHLSIRANEKDEVQLTFVLKRKIDLTKLTEELVKNNSKIVSVYYSFVPRLDSNRDLFSNKLVKIYGEDYLKIKLDEFTFLLKPNTFFQLNTKQAEKLFKLVVKKGRLNKNDIVLDAYSGVGTIATFISPHVKEVIAIEKIKEATQANILTNEINNISNLTPITGDVIRRVKELDKKFTVMVFDPPRVGLNKPLIEFILKEVPKKIIYVSCNPETLARDLKELSSKYKIDSITPFDMFPQTSHTESITILYLK